MEASALTHAGPLGIPGCSPLLRLQSDERLIALTRRGNHSAFETLVARYSSRLLAFCRHMLGSKEDAEDVLQEVFAAAFNAIQADDRPINVRPWLYRIARNRSLNHLRRVQPIGVDSMDVHYSEAGLTTADKAHRREEFRLLIADVQQLPETQRSALLLREIEALSYEQIAEAMDTTVPSVKSLLVRARVSLAEAAEARQLSCAEVRLELGAVAEGLQRTPAPVRRHVRSCDRCATFRKQLRSTNRVLAATLPVGPAILVKKLLVAHLGSTATAGGGVTAASSGAGMISAGSGAGGMISAGSGAGGMISAGAAAIATKAAAGLAAAAIVTAGAVEVQRVTTHHTHRAGVAHLVRAPIALARTGGTAETAALRPKPTGAGSPQPISARADKAGGRRLLTRLTRADKPPVAVPGSPQPMVAGTFAASGSAQLPPQSLAQAVTPADTAEPGVATTAPTTTSSEPSGAGVVAVPGPIAVAPIASPVAGDTPTAGASAGGGPTSDASAGSAPAGSAPANAPAADAPSDTTGGPPAGAPTDATPTGGPPAGGAAPTS